jgi:hypothetical protein
MPTKSTKIGGSTFAYAEQFNYPLSPCYKNTVKAGWHSGGDSSCVKKSVEGTKNDSQMIGGGIFDWLFGNGEKKKTKIKSKSAKTTTEKKKKKKLSKK